MKENITAFGHGNVLSTHPTTIEITTNPLLTTQGDCIIGVKATKACALLSDELKQKLKNDTQFTVTLKVGDIEDKITGYGSPYLILTHEHDIVLRKSEYIDKRTLMIKADKAAIDLKPELIEKLKKPNTKLNFTIEI
jgi:hypothetical protein